MRKPVAIVTVLVAIAVIVVSIVFLRGGFSGSSGPDAAPKPPPKPYEVRPDRDRLGVIADEKADYRARVEGIRKLSTRLRQKLVLDALKVLDDPKVNESIRNDLLTKLEQQEKPSGLLGPELVRMRNDAGQTPKWRNYCLQHMAPVWEVEPDNRRVLEATLLDVAGREKGVDAETALISLEKIGRKDPKVAARVRDLARTALENRANDPEKAVAAMQVLTSAGDKSVLQEARQLAVDKKAPSRLRMSAMAVLGSMGDRNDEKVLSELARTTRSRLKTAAELNLKALQKRLGPERGDS